MCSNSSIAADVSLEQALRLFLRVLDSDPNSPSATKWQSVLLFGVARMGRVLSGFLGFLCHSCSVWEGGSLSLRWVRLEAQDC